MSQATPELLVTNAGLEVATFAMPEGPYIHIVGFKIGSAYGYEPSASQTDLQGTILYSGQATSWDNIGNGILDIVMTLPPEAGPFQFGEVGLYLADSSGNFSDQSVLFAVAVFDDLQTKFSSLGTNVVSSYTFHCLLKLQQSTAVFQIDTLNGTPSVVDQFCWSDVYPPGVSANPDVPLYNMRELSPNGDASVLVNASDATWTLNGGPYYQYKKVSTNDNTFAVQNASASWIEFASTDLMPHDLSNNNRRFVIRTAEGFFRSVFSVVTSGSNYRFNLNVTNDGTYNNYPLPTVPAVGSGCTIYRDDLAGMGKIYYEQIIDPPSVALATIGNPGLATAGSGLTIQTAGTISAFGLLQSPSQNTGRVLTSSDDLNNAALASGLYATFGSIYGRPANMPQALDCTIWIHNTVGGGGGSDVTQLAFPMNNAGGDANGIGGAPVYWRQGYTTGGGTTANTWTAWQPFIMPNKTSQITYSQISGIPFNLGDLYTYIIIANPVTAGNTIQNPQVRFNGPVQPGTWRSHGEYSSGSDIFTLVFRIL